MLNFTKYFGIIIGHKVPEEIESWKLYIILRQIIDILISPRHISRHVIRLKFLILDFFHKYKEMYGHFV